MFRCNTRIPQLQPQVRFAPVLFITLLAGLLPSSARAQDLFVSSYGTNSVKRYDGTTGSFLGDFITPGSGGLFNPYGIGIGPDGNMVVTTGSKGKLLRYDGTTGAFIDTFANGVVSYALTWRPDGNAYVQDGSNGAIYQSGGTTANSLSTWAAASGYLGTGLAFGSGGFAYASDLFGGQIKRYDAGGNYLGVLATGAGSPEGLMVGPDGSLYVTDNSGNRVLRYDATTGASLGVFGDASFAGSGLDSPDDLTFGPGGDLLVTSISGNKVLRYRAGDGAYLGVFGQADAGGSGLSAPTRMFYSSPPSTSVPEPGPVAGGLAGLLAGGFGWLRLRTARRRQAGNR